MLSRSCSPSVPRALRLSHVRLISRLRSDWNNWSNSVSGGRILYQKLKRLFQDNQSLLALLHSLMNLWKTFKNRQNVGSVFAYDTTGKPLPRTSPTTFLLFFRQRWDTIALSRAFRSVTVYRMTSWLFSLRISMDRCMHFANHREFFYWSW